MIADRPGFPLLTLRPHRPHASHHAGSGAPLPIPVFQPDLAGPATCRFLELTPVSERSLIGSAGLGVRLTGSRGVVLHQKSFDPVVVAFLQDPVRDGGGFFRHLEAFAERLGDPGQERSGQGSDGGVQLADGGRITGGQPRIGWSRC